MKKKRTNFLKGTRLNDILNLKNLSNTPGGNHIGWCINEFPVFKSVLIDDIKQCVYTKIDGGDGIDAVGIFPYELIQYFTQGETK